jgi:Domain of Unknown Function (DUF1080)
MADSPRVQRCDRLSSNIVTNFAFDNILLGGLMRHLALSVLFLMPAAISGQTKNSFVPLFNGKDLDGWEVRSSSAKDKEAWSAQNGVLVAKPGGGWIGTTKMYGDFVLKVEWKIFAGGNSGVFLRVPDGKLDKSPSYHGLEVQILDDNHPMYKDKLQPYQYCAGLYHFEGPSKKMFKGAGEWNAYEITCKGGKIAVVFNGEKVIDADDAKNETLAKRPRRGFIGLQNHNSGVEFRNIMIKSLE